ncbi:TetR family transcriptional regulator [Streptomyces sp. NPDC048590]|uniref:TetR/AcrR family transcriptional regulator n=1 Tax=Streptomyces sp. NPDC048590 TaxID=3365574 RepID=UPI0037248201
MNETAGGGRFSGRRTGESGTRQAILGAARDLFAQHGFDGASMRAIAKQAGVDAGLIRHFFGDKAGLVSAVISGGTEVPDRLSEALRGDEAGIGMRVTTAYFDLWESPESGPVLEAVFRTAVNSPSAMDLLRDGLMAVMQQRILTGLGLDRDDPRMHQIALGVAHLFGVAVARYIARATPVAAVERPELDRSVAPVVQFYLVGTELP